MSKYLVMGHYNQGVAHLIDESETVEEARRLLCEFCLLFGVGWILWITKSAD